MLRLVNPRSFACLSVVCLAAVCGTARADDAATSISPLQMLTPSTALFVEITPPADGLAAVTGERFVEYLESLPQVRKALESKDFEKLRAAVAHLERKLDVRWRDALPKLLQRVTVAFDTSDQALFVFVKTADEDLLNGLHDELLSLIEADAERRGAPSPVKSAEHGDFTGYAFGKSEAHVLVGDMLIVSNQAEVLKRLIDRRADLLAARQDEKKSKRTAQNAGRRRDVPRGPQACRGR
ncbi:MAG: hypothetical protein QM775_30780 [Pirellulales bacterium]